MFVLFSALGTALAGGSVLLARLYQQAGAAIAVAVALGLIWRRTKSPAAVMLLGLNPLVVVTVVNGGHNDALVGLGVLGAVLLAEQDCPAGAGFALALAALVKITALLALPMLAAWVFSRYGRRAAGQLVGLAVATVLTGYATFGPAALSALDANRNLMSRASPWQIVRALLRLQTDHSFAGLPRATWLAAFGLGSILVVGSLALLVAWRRRADVELGTGVALALAAYLVAGIYVAPLVRDVDAAGGVPVRAAADPRLRRRARDVPRGGLRGQEPRAPERDGCGLVVARRVRRSGHRDRGAFVDRDASAQSRRPGPGSRAGTGRSGTLMATPVVPTRTARTVPLATALFATVVTLLMAAALEGAVFSHGGRDALSDIPGRFLHWHLHASLLPYGGGPVEYPVVIGYVSWIAAWLGRRTSTFFVVNGVLSAALALGLTAVLRPYAGRRIWRWVAAPALVLYAFHNWDLLALAPTIVAVLAFDRHRDRLSGGLLAIGASAKVFPGLVLVPLAAVRWRSGDRRGAARLVGVFAAVTVMLNGPIALRSWSAWTYPLSFQGGRAPTWGSTWYWLLRSPVTRAPVVHELIAHHLTTVADVAGVLTLAGALVLISTRAVRHHLDAVAIAAAVVGAFLLTNKVYSPNYDLWLVPFFALLPVARRVWVAFCLSDLAIFVLVYGHFHGQWSSDVVLVVLPVLVTLRALTILALILAALRLPVPGLRRPDGARAARGDGGGRDTRWLVRAT